MSLVERGKGLFLTYFPINEDAYWKGKVVVSLEIGLLLLHAAIKSKKTETVASEDAVCKALKAGSAIAIKFGVLQFAGLLAKSVLRAVDPPF